MTALPLRKIANYGWIPDHPDHRDRLFNLEEPVLQAHQLPAAVDLTHNMPGIYDQGQLGSCTGNGIARAMEASAIKQGDPAVTPSRLFIYYYERVIEGTVDQDAGAQIRDGIKVVATKGVPPETAWPYDIDKFAVRPTSAAYEQATHDKAVRYQRITLGGAGAPIRSAVASGRPVVFGFSVPAQLEDPDWDPVVDALPVPGPRDEIIGGHCATITGYDYTKHRFPVNVVQIDNSWGPEWGDNGRFYMDAAWFNPHAGLVSDLWVITEVS